MASTTKSLLLKEYVKKFKRIYIPLFSSGAFHRFDIKDDEIVSKSKFSMFYSIIAVLMVDFSAYFLLLETTVKNNYLILPELISVIQLTIWSNLVVLNINFANRHSGAELMRNFIEIDAFLGIQKTRFMRRISSKDIVIWCGLLTCFQVILDVILILTFPGSLLFYITGVTYFWQLFCMSYDNIFHVISYKFLCMRVHYLNIALVKTAKLYKEYLIDQLLVYPFHWKKGDNDFVNSHSSADWKYFTVALRMIFDQLQRITTCYRFLIFTFLVTLILSTFMAVQSVIIFIKDPEVPVIRTMALTGWFIVAWTILIAITHQTDQFYVQIQRTKLICTYIQLKPNNSDEIYELSKRILDTLNVSDHRYSIYDMFYFDGRLVISIATSVFVYITMQLQIAFTKQNNQSNENTTYLQF